MGKQSRFLKLSMKILAAFKREQSTSMNDPDEPGLTLLYLFSVAIVLLFIASDIYLKYYKP